MIEMNKAGNINGMGYAHGLGNGMLADIYEEFVSSRCGGLVVLAV
jgi:hypothetical protein